MKEEIDMLIYELAIHITEITKNNLEKYENEITDKTRALAELITARALVN